MKYHPFQRHLRTRFPEVSVSESDNIRSLHLGTDTVQSAMNLDNPSELVLAYSQAMVSCLLFLNRISHVTHIGLGGGSLVRWFNEFFPEIKQLAIEINPQIVSIANAMFNLPDENDNFEIVIADGAEFIRVMQSNTDIILTDAFDGEQIIDELTETEFLTDCYNALTDKGIFVTNLWSADKRYQTFVKRIEEVFNNKVIEVSAARHGNVAVMGLKSLPENISEEQLKKRAQQLANDTSTDFLHSFHAIRSNNQKRKLW